MTIIDAHIHCGNNPRTKYYSENELLQDLAAAGAVGAVIFAFPEDIYRIDDSPEARMHANQYCLEVAERNPGIIPFYFVWNDYIIPDNIDKYRGIKWHRHSDEPRYDYSAPECREILQEIQRLHLPVVLEEEFEMTADFIKRNPHLMVIIPHMGNLNGGYERMDAFFDNPNVFFDTSVASIKAISRTLNAVGPERVIFGSDVSGTSEPFFNFPEVELAKLSKLKLSDRELELILGGNILRLTGIAAEM